MKPKVKPTHGPVRAYTGYVAIGVGTDFNVQIEDKDGSIEHLLRLMDGSRTIPKIVSEMRARFPHLSENDIFQGVSQFDDAGFLEDATRETSLTELELQRYGNNLNFFSVVSNLSRPNTFWQERVRNLHVCVLGLGGVGSAVVQNFAGLGVKKLTLIDKDTVAFRNLNRQFAYDSRDIGRRKTDAIRQKLAFLNGDVETEEYSMELNSSSDISRTIKDANVVIACVDTPASVTSMVNTACVTRSIPYVNGGFRGSGAAYFSVIPGKTGCYGCLEYHLSQKIPEYYDQIERLLPEYGEFLGHGTGTGMGAGILAGWMTMEALRITLGLSDPVATNRSIEINFLTSEQKTLYHWERTEHCDVCRHVTS